MNNIIEIISKLKSFRKRHPVDDKSINFSEKYLGIVFSEEYSKYVSSFGAVSWYGHELTGICNSPRLNVVDVTVYERNLNPDMPKDWYVIEQTGIDGIVIWQNQEGEIYQTQPYKEPVKIADSLVEYIMANNL